VRIEQNLTPKHPVVTERGKMKGVVLKSSADLADYECWRWILLEAAKNNIALKYRQPAPPSVPVARSLI
jgi:hypothetical protein